MMKTLIDRGTPPTHILNVEIMNTAKKEWFVQEICYRLNTDWKIIDQLNTFILKWSIIKDQKHISYYMYSHANDELTHKYVGWVLEKILRDLIANGYDVGDVKISYLITKPLCEFKIYGTQTINSSTLLEEEEEDDDVVIVRTKR